MSVNNVPLGLAEVPEESNALTVYALDKNGVWLPALTVHVEIDQINHENWERPLRLAVGADRLQMPE